jgi:hypothetical protein
MSPRWDVPGFFGGVLLCLEKDVGNHGEKPNLVQWFIVIVPFKMATTGVAHRFHVFRHTHIIRIQWVYNQ